MVRVEEQLKSIEERQKATHELLVEERAARKLTEEGMQHHMAEDDRRFASIDSRLQGTQAQLSTMADTLKRIEAKVDGKIESLEKRLGVMEDGEKARSAVRRFLDSTWTHVLGGGGIVGLSLAFAVAVGWL